MSEPVTSQFNSPFDDAFDDALLEEQVELNALKQALQLGAYSREFHLIFARCNVEPYQQALIRRLQAELPNLTIQHIHFDEKIDHLLDQLRWRLAEPMPDAVFVTGLEHSYSAPTERPRQSPLILNLNASRNSFARHVPRPLILWLPETMLTALFHGAPDFFSVRAGVYFFAASAETTGEVAESLTAESDLITDNLTEAEKRNRIAAIHSLLVDYEAQPKSRRMLKAERGLLHQLASLQESQGQAEAALRSIEQALAISGEIGDRRGEGADLGNLGNAYASLGEVRRAIENYEQALAIACATEDKQRESIWLTNLGNAWRQLKDAKQAIEHYEQALAIDREREDHRREAASFGKIGDVYLETGEASRAVEYFDLAINAARRAKDQKLEAGQRWKLSQAWEAAGERAKAIRSAEEALTLAEANDQKLAEEVRSGLEEWQAAATSLAKEGQ